MTSTFNFVVKIPNLAKQKVLYRQSTHISLRSLSDLDPFFWKARGIQIAKLISAAD